MTQLPLRIAVLISGGGTTLKNLIDRKARGELPVDICQVISSRFGARGIDIATEAGIPTCVLPRKSYGTPEAYRDAIFGLCRDAQIELVVMGGFLQHVLIPDDFENRVINIHPSLIPAFSGKGYYGLHVHEAVVQSGATTTGCTVHYVDNQYDHGPIILQRSCNVLKDDTPETLQCRVMQLERDALPAAISAIANERVPFNSK